MNKESKFIQEIEKMSVMDLAKFVAALQKSLGVPVTAYGGSSLGTTGSTVATESAKTSFNVVCESVPADKKMAAIKLVREILTIGLKEAKDLVDGFPKTIAEDVDKAKADELQKKLTEAGIVVSVK